ncbi:MAG: UDP-N-acetylmuramate--L-alanine ligase [Actinomycetaceae bacterium]|nr:UDP-N-acetylmuramate--L-alanine ligase [Actinomycetaceae bacterium]
MKKFHFIGIGGAGMSVVAELLTGRGLQISGSDAKDSARLQALRKQGIDAYAPHDAARLPEDATIVVSSAIRPSNPELAKARVRGQTVLHRSQALAIAAAGMDFIAVAGAHGKTTSSAMLASALMKLGVDPSYAIGGSVLGKGSGAHLGKGEVFVAEADESDGSFLNYQPKIALVTNVEADHLDHYGSLAAFEQAFADFAGLVTGTLVVCADDEGAARLAKVAQSGSARVLTYGRNGAVKLVVAGDGADAAAFVVYEGERAPLRLQVPGYHNLLNATGVVAVMLALGFPLERACAAQKAFVGTGRRFELRGQVRGITVRDDYAHHPTEVGALVDQARSVTAGRILVMFQPHLYSRTQNFADRFAKALRGADEVVLAPIFGAREDPVPGVTSALIAQHLPGARLCQSLSEGAQMLADMAEAGDLVITVGAGDITNAATEILDRLNAQGS